MDQYVPPLSQVNKVKIGDNILDTEREEQFPVHSKLAEPVKEGATVYAISQAFQTGLPGVNR